MIYKKMILLFIAAAFFLVGCQPPILVHQSESNVADVAQKATAAREKSDADAKLPAPLIVSQDLYVDKTPISLAKQPSWLKNHIVLRGDQLPFSYYSKTVVNGSGKNILLHYQNGLDPSLLTSMNYTGTVKGALDTLAAKTGYAYSVNGNDIYWQVYITKTFDIAFMPGSSDYMMGKASGGAAAAAPAGGGGGGGASSTVSSGVTDDSASAQYSNLKGTLSIWKDLEATIKELLSPEGRVIVSEATTSVTVRDKPANIALAARFIANLNNNISKQVLVKIQILEVQLASDYNYGIDWQAVTVKVGANGKFILSGNASTPISIAAIGGTKAATATVDTGSVTALINALKQQGKVSLVSEPRVVCLNNQVSVVRIVDQVGYLASVQNTTQGASISGQTTSQVTPGVVVTGLTLYVLPKIINNKIFLQVNADLSNNLGFDTVSTAGDSKDVAVLANAASIQVPKITQKQFNQRSMISSGETLILAGFRQVKNQTGATQVFGSQALGGQSAIQSNTETIVLITPIIMHGPTA